ncbi:MAG: hypothetical protein WBB82_12250, partial [Limnothrix sp.]
HAKEQALKQKNPAPQPPVNSFVKLPDGTTVTPDDGEVDEVNLFPLVNEVEEMALEVTDARLLGNYWVMDISLQNKGRESVRFLYDFVELKDQDSRLLSAQTEGLPGEVPANNQRYEGTIRVPAVILEESETVSLYLSDYPTQEIKLEILDIPVVR